MSLLHLSLLHLDEDKTALSQEVSSMKMEAETSGGTEIQPKKETRHSI